MFELYSPFSQELDRRVRGLLFLAGLGFMLLALRLFHLQVIRGGTFSRLADLNRTQIIPLQAPRGFVWDRNGDILIDNAPSFSLLYTAQSVPLEAQKDLEDELVRLFPESESTVRRKLAEARKTGKMMRIFSSIPRPAALALMEKKMALPGVNVLAEPRRRVRYGPLAAHILGYVNEVSPLELKRNPETYKPGDLVGRNGIERVYDEQLRGVDGGLQFEMDAVGHHVRTVQRIPSETGLDLVLTLDRRLQQAAEAGLDQVAKELADQGVIRGGLRGAAVVLDPRNGAVLAMASRPSYDASAGLVRYLLDPDRPLFNRAIQGGYPPGSVFKIITALAGLQDGRWNIHKVIVCPGVYHLGNIDFGCWKTHGALDYMGAMAWSCNVYFFNIGLRAKEAAIVKFSKALGLGEKSGIDLPIETAGLVPSAEWKRRRFKDNWRDGDTLNVSIGQGGLTLTPLQVAGFIAAVANGGTLWKPFVLERMVDTRGQIVYQHKPEQRRRVDVQPEILRIVQRSMVGVVEGGTGGRVYRSDLVVGGKTGTAQNAHGDDHAWFACYAGRKGEEPSLVVAVITENSGHGATAAAPVAKAVIDEAFPMLEKTRG